MTRKNQTKQEIKFGHALLQHLKKEDNNASFIERDINDDPDLFFKFKKINIGCECVQIPSSKIFKYQHSRFKQLTDKKKSSSIVKVIWPNEPHSWMSEAIKAKTKNIERYKINTQSDEIWLLVHTSLNEKETIIKSKEKITFDCFNYAANKCDHEFERIYFCDAENNITLIYPTPQIVANLNIDFSKGYPTSNFWMSRLSIRTTAADEPPKTIDYGIIEPETIFIPPIDSDYKKYEPNFTNFKYHFFAIVNDTSFELKLNKITN